MSSHEENLRAVTIKVVTSFPREYRSSLFSIFGKVHGHKNPWVSSLMHQIIRQVKAEAKEQGISIGKAGGRQEKRTITKTIKELATIEEIRNSR